MDQHRNSCEDVKEEGTISSEENKALILLILDRSFYLAGTVNSCTVEADNKYEALPAITGSAEI